jgi:regulator of protease activity HflC (stomatin/prohibitin superfamily)
MSKLREIVERIQDALASLRERAAPLSARLGENGSAAAGSLAGRLGKMKGTLLAVGVLGVGAYWLSSHPPMKSVGRGEVGVRLNRWNGEVSEFRDGAFLLIPGMHELRVLPLRDQVYRPGAKGGAAPFQSVEGLALGVDISVRYALDPAKVAAVARALPDDIGGEVVEPAVQGVIYKTLARYTVREIFSSKRQEIQQTIESELKPRLAADGIVVQAVQMGKVELPADYRAGMERLLAEELETEKMRYTLELKEKHVKQTALEAEADKVRRGKAAEAAGDEQIIAARAQAEAMKHVLPFKQKQIEQRGLEAEAEKVSRLKGAEANAQARRIEAAGEAESRQKLVDAEAYRQERIGKIASEQLARDGALLTRHPLLIQKTMADKLSDKIQVIIAAPGTGGGFIGANLIGGGSSGGARVVAERPETTEEER